MNNMEQWMRSVEYKITEGSEYTWDCYPDAHCLDSWNGEHDGHSFSVIFSTVNQTVYEMQAHDYANNRAYRWIDPDWREANSEQCRDAGVDPNIAWDGQKYTDLEVVEDYFAKVAGIRSGEPYDTRISVPIDLPDEELFQLMKMAHEADITLNQMVERMLIDAIELKRISDILPDTI